MIMKPFPNTTRTQYTWHFCKPTHFQCQLPRSAYTNTPRTTYLRSDDVRRIFSTTHFLRNAIRFP